MLKCLVGSVLAFGVLLLQGCVAVQALPTAARAGDTVTLAVGSAEGMSRTNTSITYTPDTAPQTPVSIPASNIRAIIPVYPDKRTRTWTSSSAATIDVSTGHGAWLTVLVVDLPSSLPVGTGVINIQTGAQYSPYGSSVNGQDISLEIVPGTGSSHLFKYLDGGSGAVLDGDLSALETWPYYRLRPDLSADPLFPEWPLYAAVEMRITTSYAGGTESQLNGAMRVVLEDMEQHMQSQAQMSWYRSGNEIVVNLVSPMGRLSYYEAAVSLFFTNNNYVFTTPPVVVARYYDVTGQEVVGPDINAQLVTSQ